MQRNAAAFLGRLALRIPDLREDLAAHVEYHGQVLSHVLMGSITRRFRENPDASWTTALLAELEAALDDSDDPVSNLIGVSFIENLLDQPAARSRLAAGEFPRLLQDFDAMHGRHKS